MYRGTRASTNSFKGQNGFQDPLDKLDSLTSSGPLDSLSSGSVLGGGQGPPTPDGGSADSVKGWRKGKKTRSNRFMNSFRKYLGGHHSLLAVLARPPWDSQACHKRGLSKGCWFLFKTTAKAFWYF
jgi:hypothetical protein